MARALEVCFSEMSFHFTENGSLAAGANEWVLFAIHTTPGTSRHCVMRTFSKLYDMDRRKAFCMAMMFGNLRKGGGGRADMPTFMACMDVIWRNNPQHIVSNIRFIMEVRDFSSASICCIVCVLICGCYEQHVSCKMALVMLKHFSNPSEDHPNNYWGNLDLIEKRKCHRMTYRPAVVMDEYDRIPYWVHWEKTELKQKADDARIEVARRRERRFNAHVRMLEDFFIQKVCVDGFIDELFQVCSFLAKQPLVVCEISDAGGQVYFSQLQCISLNCISLNCRFTVDFSQLQILTPKAHVRDRFYQVYQNMWCPKSLDIQTLFENFRILHARLVCIFLS